jgi:inosine/guanosine/xanthosine phosphorylase family protein
MDAPIDLSILDDAVSAVKQTWPDATPSCGLILGSGWGEAVSGLLGDEISYDNIPGLGSTGVMGHAGRLRRSSYEGTDLLVFQGRRHWYEGEGWTPVILPVYLLHALGATTVLLTNASGGIHHDLPPGSLMVIADHINLLGSNPLIGPHRPELGTRFPDQSAVYDTELQNMLMVAGADRRGTYVATTGPTFETPAEIKAFAAMGADAVGMSTVPEAIMANALGMRVTGLSCICNWAAGLGQTRLTHDDVTTTAERTIPRMKNLIDLFLKELFDESQ